MVVSAEISAAAPRHLLRTQPPAVAATGSSTLQRQGCRSRRVGESRSMAAAAVAVAQQQERGVRRVQLQAVDVTPENFRPFGQVVGPCDDGKHFDGEEAQLVLDKGTPRFYIMRLPRRGRCFQRITYHANVTQCLGGLAPVQPWYLAVAAPTLSVEAYPRQEDLTVFRVPHGVFLKLKQGTWHAGPLFDGDSMDFYNLELSDTNVVDHNTHHYAAETAAGEGLLFEVVD